MDYDDVYAQMLELDFESNFYIESEFDWEEVDLSQFSL
jgi:hypothetical protein